jgi:hypothetical protein
MWGRDWIGNGLQTGDAGKIAEVVMRSSNIRESRIESRGFPLERRRGTMLVAGFVRIRTAPRRLPEVSRLQVRRIVTVPD